MGAERAERELVAVAEQPVELAAVALELGAGVEHLAEGLLHHDDVVADAELAAEFLLHIGRRRQVIGMHMGLEHPFAHQTPVAHIGDDLVGRGGRGAPGGGIVVEHRVEHRAGLRRRIGDHVAHGVGRLVEESLYVRTVAHGAMPLMIWRRPGRPRPGGRTSRPPIMPTAMAAMKMNGSRRSDTTAAMAGPGQKPDRPQPSPKIAAPATRRASMSVFVGQPETLGKQRLGARQHQFVADEGGDDGTAEHEQQRGIEAAGKIEKIEHLGRVDHARDRKPGAEQQTRQKCDKKRHKNL
jgi:hypothetical protein